MSQNLRIIQREQQRCEASALWSISAVEHQRDISTVLA